MALTKRRCDLGRRTPDRRVCGGADTHHCLAPVICAADLFADADTIELSHNDSHLRLGAPELRAWTSGIDATLRVRDTAQTPRGDALTVAEPVPGTYATMINGIGGNRFPDVFTGCRQNDDGSVTIYVGPGDSTPLMDAIRGADLTRVAGLTRNASAAVSVPDLHLERVQVALGPLSALSKQVRERRAEFAAAGYPPSVWGPQPETGTLDIALSNTPDGGTEAATAYFQDHLSPFARVVRLGVQPRRY